MTILSIACMLPELSVRVACKLFPRPCIVIDISFFNVMYFYTSFNVMCCLGRGRPRKTVIYEFAEYSNPSTDNDEIPDFSGGKSEVKRSEHHCHLHCISSGVVGIMLYIELFSH